MDVMRFFPSKYIACSDLNGQCVSLTIRELKATELDDDNGSKVTKPVLFFVEAQKGLLLNKTNARAIAGIYGRETDQWIGKPITIFPAQTEYKGEPVECVRVKLQPPPAEVMPQQQPVQQPPVQQPPAQQPQDQRPGGVSF